MKNKLLKAKNGSRKDQEDILTSYKPLMISCLRKYALGRDWDDSLQEAYVLGLEAIGDFDPDYGVDFGYYFKLKLNYFYLGKDQPRQVYYHEKDPGGQEYIEGFSSDFDLEGRVLEREREQKLKEGLAKLSKREREIVSYFYYGELSLAEIAELLDLSYQTVANTKTNGINKLKNLVRF